MSQSGAIIDKLLTNVSRGLFNQPSDFIVDQILPIVTSAQSSGKIGSYGKENLRVVTTLMGGKGKALRINSNTTSSDTFYIEPHGLSDVVTKQDKMNYEKPFEALSDSTMQLWEMLQLAKEKALADSMRSTSVMTNYTTLSGTSQFSDYNNSDPIGVSQDAHVSTYDSAGRTCNTVVMGWKGFNQLRYHPQILENLGFTYQRAGQMSPVELAGALNVERVLIGKAQINNVDLGQSDSLSDIWADDVIYCYAPTSAKLRDQSLGFQVRPTKSAVGVYKAPLNNPPEATEIVHTMDYDFVITDVNCGYLVENAIA